MLDPVATNWEKRGLSPGYCTTLGFSSVFDQIEVVPPDTALEILCWPVARKEHSGFRVRCAPIIPDSAALHPGYSFCSRFRMEYEPLECHQQGTLNDFVDRRKTCEV